MAGFHFLIFLLGTTLVRDPSEPKIIAGSDVLFEYLTKERLVSDVCLGTDHLLYRSLSLSISIQ